MGAYGTDLAPPPALIRMLHARQHNVTLITSVSAFVPCRPVVGSLALLYVWIICKLVSKIHEC